MLQQSIIQSLNKYLFSAYYAPGTVLGAGARWRARQVQSLPCGATAKAGVRYLLVKSSDESV